MPIEEILIIAGIIAVIVAAIIGWIFIFSKSILLGFGLILACIVAAIIQMEI